MDVTEGKISVSRGSSSKPTFGYINERNLNQCIIEPITIKTRRVVVLLALLEISGYLSRFYPRSTIGLVKLELLSSI